MNSKPDLVIDWCDHRAAQYAVEKWHYSHVMPTGKTAKIGIWESGIFSGVVIFSLGANRHIASPYGLDNNQVCELTRVALNKHNSPTSKIVSAAVKMLSKQSPGIKLIVSYADPEQGHIGTIYQAMNWIYTGTSKAQRALMVNGVTMHKRTGHGRFNGHIGGLEYSAVMWKHKYLLPMDKDTRKAILPLAQPYPKKKPLTDCLPDTVHTEQQ